MIYAIAYECTAELREPFNIDNEMMALQDIYAARKNVITTLSRTAHNKGFDYSPSGHFIEKATDGMTGVTVVAREFFEKDGRFRERDMETVKDLIKTALKVSGNRFRLTSYIDEERLDGTSLTDTMELHTNAQRFTSTFHSSGITAINDFTSDINPYRYSGKWHYWVVRAAYTMHLDPDKTDEDDEDLGTPEMKDDDRSFMEASKKAIIALEKAEASTDALRYYLDNVGSFLVRQGGTNLTDIKGSNAAEVRLEYYIGIENKELDKRKDNAENIITAAVMSAQRRICKDIGLFMISFEVEDYGSLPASPKAYVLESLDNASSFSPTETFANDISDETSETLHSSVAVAITLSLKDDDSLPEDWRDSDACNVIMDFDRLLSDNIVHIIGNPRKYGLDENSEDVSMHNLKSSYLKDDDKPGERGILCMLECTVPPYACTAEKAEAIVMPVVNLALEKTKLADRLSVRNVHFVPEPSDEKANEVFLDYML